MNPKTKRIIAREWLIIIIFGITGFIPYSLAQLSAFRGDMPYNEDMIWIGIDIWLCYGIYLIVKSIVWAVRASRQK